MQITIEFQLLVQGIQRRLVAKDRERPIKGGGQRWPQVPGTPKGVPH